MDVMDIEAVVRNIDHRLERVEQFLPLLATRDELREAIAPLATKADLRASLAEAIAPLATKDELREAIAPLATKAELRTSIAEAIAPLATKAELRTSIAEAIAPLATKEQLEDNRRHAQVLFESLQDSIRMVADGVSHLTAEVREMKSTVWPKIEEHDIRLLALETGRSPRRRR